MPPPVAYAYGTVFKITKASSVFASAASDSTLELNNKKEVHKCVLLL
jgi:hypothetical protein